MEIKVKVKVKVKVKTIMMNCRRVYGNQGKGQVQGQDYNDDL